MHLRPHRVLFAALLLSAALYPRSAAAQQVKIDASLGVSSPDHPSRLDGATPAPSGPALEIPAYLGAFTTFAERLTLGLWLSALHRSLDTPDGTLEANSLRELGAEWKLSYHLGPKDAIQGSFAVGGKVDVGDAPWEAALPTSNGQHAIFADLTPFAYALPGSCYTRLKLHALYNIAAEDAAGQEVQSGSVLSSHLLFLCTWHGEGLAYLIGLPMQGVELHAAVEPRFTYAGAARRAGAPIAGSDLQLLHLASYVGFTTRYGTLLLETSVAQEDFALGIALLGRSAPSGLPFTISYQLPL